MYILCTAPTGVSAPTDPQSISGYIIEVKWQQPNGNTGVITQYILTAYNLDEPSLDPVTADFTDTTTLEYTGKYATYLCFIQTKCIYKKMTSFWNEI